MTKSKNDPRAVTVEDITPHVVTDHGMAYLPGEREALAESIAAHGILEPIPLTQCGTVALRARTRLTVWQALRAREEEGESFPCSPVPATVGEAVERGWAILTETPANVSKGSLVDDVIASDFQRRSRSKAVLVAGVADVAMRAGRKFPSNAAISKALGGSKGFGTGRAKIETKEAESGKGVNRDTIAQVRRLWSITGRGKRGSLFDALLRCEVDLLPAYKATQTVPDAEGWAEVIANVENGESLSDAELARACMDACAPNPDPTNVAKATSIKNAVKTALSEYPTDNGTDKAKRAANIAALSVVSAALRECLEQVEAACATS